MNLRLLALAGCAIALVHLHDAPVAHAQDHGESGTPSNLEGRPPLSQRSTLQARIDAAPADGVVHVEAGTWRGDLMIDKPLTLIGHGRPLLLGSGAGSVVRIRAPYVTIEGFDIDGGGGGDLGTDPSGIHIATPHATVRDCRVRNTLFGIYLRAADDAVVERSEIHGIRGKAPGEKGSGIHLWNTQRFRLSGNTIVDVRDGFYIQSSSNGLIDHNHASDLRYGLHYMYSDDNTFEDNTFERGDAGTALMYSRRIVFRRNRFLRNRGFASVGLLFKTCDDVLAEDNLVADNARGIFLEGSARTTFRRNIIAGSDIAIVLYDSTSESRFNGNSFVGNMTPLMLVGRRTDTNFDGNYWSDNRELDLDGDGRADRPYRLSSAFDHFRGNLTAADLYVDGFAALAMAAAETTFPVLEPIAALDRQPLAQPPALPRTPRVDRVAAQNLVGLAVAATILVLGVMGLRAPRGSRRKERSRDSLSFVHQDVRCADRRA
jgi:nitrous oxidase accessory protein